MRASGRIISGSKAARIGKDLEKALEMSHDAYEAMGLAWIRKLPLPTVYAGTGIFRRTATQVWDYQGVFGPEAGSRSEPWLYHGVSLGMEAKASGSAKTSLPISPSTKSGGGISVHQLKSLAVRFRDWGICTALVWLNGDDLLVLLPDACLAAYEVYESGGRKSIPVDQFRRAEIMEYPDFPVVLDWLYELRRWIGENGLPGAALSHVRQYQMITYRIDAANGRVRIKTEDGWKEVQTRILDRAFLDRLAGESTSAEDFEQKIQHAELANE